MIILYISMSYSILYDDIGGPIELREPFLSTAQLLGVRGMQLHLLLILLLSLPHCAKSILHGYA